MIAKTESHPLWELRAKRRETEDGKRTVELAQMEQMRVDLATALRGGRAIQAALARMAELSVAPQDGAFDRRDRSTYHSDFKKLEREIDHKVEHEFTSFIKLGQRIAEDDPALRVAGPGFGSVINDIRRIFAAGFGSRHLGLQQTSLLTPEQAQATALRVAGAEGAMEVLTGRLDDRLRMVHGWQQALVRQLEAPPEDPPPALTTVVPRPDAGEGIDVLGATDLLR